jgi:hypothetical protein
MQQVFSGTKNNNTDELLKDTEQINITPQNIFMYSKKTENIVELLKDENQMVWIQRYYIDNSTIESVEEFCEILKKAFEESEKIGGKIHAQYIHKNEWDIFLNKDDRWEFIEEYDDNIIHIECDINDAPDCIIKIFLNKY